MTGNTYDSLIQKLDAFIRKYYKNQLIRGAIYFAAATLLFFFLVIVLEYFGRYQPTTRAALFYSFVTLAVLPRALYAFFASLYKLGKPLITHKPRQS
jgi:hypothetical protein